MNKNKKIVIKYVYVYNIPQALRITYGGDDDSVEKYVNFLKNAEAYFKKLSIDGEVGFEISSAMIDDVCFSYKTLETDAEFETRIKNEQFYAEQAERDFLEKAEKLGYEVKRK